MAIRGSQTLWTLMLRLHAERHLCEQRGLLKGEPCRSVKNDSEPGDMLNFIFSVGCVLPHPPNLAAGDCRPQAVSPKSKPQVECRPVSASRAPNLVAAKHNSHVLYDCVHLMCTHYLF